MSLPTRRTGVRPWLRRMGSSARGRPVPRTFAAGGTSEPGGSAGGARGECGGAARCAAAEAGAEVTEGGVACGVGGGVSDAGAAHDGSAPQFGASVVYCGTPPAADRLSSVHATVLGFYGGTDARIALTVPGTDSAMRALGRTYDHTIFAGAAHGFLRAQTQRDGSIMQANLDATRQAWPATIAWFRKNLK